MNKSILYTPCSNDVHRLLSANNNGFGSLRTWKPVHFFTFSSLCSVLCRHFFSSHGCIIQSSSLLFIPVLFFPCPLLSNLSFHVVLPSILLLSSIPSNLVCSVLLSLILCSPSFPNSSDMDGQTGGPSRWGYHGYGCIID